MESKQEINLKRSTAMALLARLGLSDIPYALSKQSSDDLSRYLSNIMLNKMDETDEIIVINIEDLKKHVINLDDVITILNYYSTN